MTEPRRGSGRFQWNTSGWFGGQVGGTLWIFGVGISACSMGHPGAGAIILAAGVATNITGVALWRNRHRIAPYAAIQGLILLLGLAMLTTFITLDVTGLPFVYKFGQYRSEEMACSYYWFLATIPALLVLFWIKNRSRPRSSVGDLSEGEHL